MAQPSPQTISKQPKWVVSIDRKKYVNSTAISGSGALVMAGTFFHAYKPTDLLADSVPALTAAQDQFGTYCFDLNGKQLWSDEFTGYEGVYCVGISDDGSTAASGGWYSYNPLMGFVRAYDAADGTQLFNYPVAGSRISSLALSADGTTLVAGADSLYLFQQSDGVFPTTPAVLTLSGARNYVQAVSISEDGTLIVMGDAQGNVYLIETNGGQIGQVYKWNSPSLATVHSVAMAASGGWFAVVGASQYVYLFSFASIKNGNYYAVYDLGQAGRVGWVAITKGGDFISAVSNNGKAGLVYGLQNKNQELVLLWSNPQPTPANPNSTSVDFLGKYVAVADGYPDGTPGHFSLFDAPTGNLLWQYETTNMSWPMFISSNGSGIAAGSDQGSVFYFTPK
ncbi:MAG: PQQ-binding-like beta-propeller repeat protein [bacterium]